LKTETIIRILTISALAGLLGAVGLRLTLGEVTQALKRCRFVAILIANFIVVPALTVAAARVFGLGRDITIAMILLGAAPFAPVVPVFARMARSDLALAAGLTSIYPLLSAFLTPVAQGRAGRGFNSVQLARRATDIGCNNHTAAGTGSFRQSPMARTWATTVAPGRDHL
jgi:predicted Na+-dependent transporter